MKSKPYIFNGPAPAAKPWFKVVNAGSDTEPAELSIYDQIGRDPWDNSGTGGKEFAEALKAIPAGRKINVRINSPGGSVWDGLLIYNTLLARRKDVACIVEGIALSAASFIACAGGETRMAKASVLMIHNPATFCQGDSEDMKKMAAELETHADVLAGIYADKSGKPKSDWRAAMDSETWYTADEAKEAGLCDCVTEACCPQNTFNLSGFKRVPEALSNHAPKNSAAKSGEANTNTMKEKLIALLKQRGVTNIPADATEEQLLALIPAPAAPTAPANTPDPALASVQAELAKIKAARENERKARITAAVEVCATDCRIPLNDRQAWVDRILADETLLPVVQALPVNLPGTDPVSAAVEITAESVKDIERHCLKLKGAPRTAFLRKHLNRITPVLNTNTIATDLKRIALMDAQMRAFKRILTQFRMFSTVHLNVPLQGTDKVGVPYYALEAAASADFNGTYAIGNTTTDIKEVTINKRKYQGMLWTSSEFRRQPYLNIEQLAVLKAEKLAYDIWVDVQSLIINANFSNKLVKAFASADSTWIADIRNAANKLQWPEVGRSMLVASDYDNAFLKDDSFKVAFAFGDANPIKEGQIRRAFGFDYYMNPNIPGNSENLAGYAAFVSAILVATAPIEPTQEVRQRLTAYDVVVDSDTGIAFEYRRWGDPDTDSSKEVIECNYGYDLGNTDALIRLVTA